MSGVPETAFVLDQPQRLWWLLAVPLILWGLQRLRPRAALLPVPSLALWKLALSRARGMEHRWLRWVLCALQAAILSGLIVLWADPQQVRTQPGEGTTLLVLDRTLNTLALDAEGVPLCTRVIQRACELLPAARRAGRTGLAFLGAGFHAAGVTGDDEAVDRSIEEPPPPAGRRDLAALLALAKAAEAPVRVAWITPFEPTTAEHELLRAARVVCVSAGVPLPQAGLRRVARGGPDELRVLVQGHGPARTLQIVCAESVLGEVPVQPSTEGVEVVVPVPHQAQDLLELRLMPPDAFTADDTAVVALPERRRLAVLLVSDQANAALDAWLAASDCVDPQRSGRIGSAELVTTRFRAEVIVLHGVRGVKALPAEACLLIDATAEQIPVSIAGEQRMQAALLSVERRDPLLRGLEFGDLDMPAMPVVDSADALDVLVRTSAGPLLLRGRSGALRFLSLCAPLDRASSNLSALPLLPVLLDSALRELGLPRHALLPACAESGGSLLLHADEGSRLTQVGSGAAWELERRRDGLGFHAPPPGAWRSSTGRAVATACLNAGGPFEEPLQSVEALASFPPQDQREPARGALLVLLGALMLVEWLLPLLLARRA